MCSETLHDSGSDNLVDTARLTVLCAIARYVHCFGDVPIQLVMFAISGHTGSEDCRSSTEDPSWDTRNTVYDEIMPDDIREKARLERVRTKDEPNLILDKNALCIVAMNDAGVLKRMSDQLTKQRAARQAKHARLLDGYVSDVSESEAHGEGAQDVADDSDFAGVTMYSEEDDLYAQMEL